MLGEGTEEYLQEILEPVYRNLIFDENNEIKLVSEDAAYSFLLGALTAGLLEGKSGISTGISESDRYASYQDELRIVQRDLALAELEAEYERNVDGLGQPGEGIAEQTEEVKTATVEDARPEFEEMQSIGLLRMPELDKFAEMKYNDTPAYQNLTGERIWSAVEFNPETVAEHVKSHGAGLELKTAQEYEAAALAFVNETRGKLSFTDAAGTKRFFEESTGILASVYPDGTIRTFFRPRKGIEYWEAQVRKYGSR